MYTQLVRVGRVVGFLCFLAILFILIVNIPAQGQGADDSTLPSTLDDITATQVNEEPVIDNGIHTVANDGSNNSGSGAQVPTTTMDIKIPKPIPSGFKLNITGLNMDSWEGGTDDLDTRKDYGNPEHVETVVTIGDDPNYQKIFTGLAGADDKKSLELTHDFLMPYYHCDDNECTLSITVDLEPNPAHGDGTTDFGSYDHENQFSVNWENSNDGTRIIHGGGELVKANRGKGNPNPWNSRDFFSLPCSESGASVLGAAVLYDVDSPDNGTPGLKNDGDVVNYIEVMRAPMGSDPLGWEVVSGTGKDLKETYYSRGSTEYTDAHDNQIPKRAGDAVVITGAFEPGYVYMAQRRGINHNDTWSIVLPSNMSSTNLDDCNKLPDPKPDAQAPTCSIDTENMVVPVSATITYGPFAGSVTPPAVVGVRLTIETNGNSQTIPTAAHHTGGGVYKLSESVSFSSVGADPNATTQSFNVSMQVEGIDKNGNPTDVYRAIGGSGDCEHEEPPLLDCTDPSTPPCPQTTCTDPSQRVFPSKGTQLEGRSYPILSKFAPIGGDDPVRLYRYTWDVQGPSGSGSGQVRALKGGVGTYEITANASRGFHDYKWEYDWDYDWQIEQAWQRAWDGWQSAHSPWVPDHKDWFFVRHPNWLADRPLPGNYDRNHPHVSCGSCPPCTTTINDDGSSTTSCNTCCSTSYHDHFADALAAWYAREPQEPQEPVPPSNYPMKTGKLGFAYSPDWGNYAGLAAGKKFGDPGQFVTHPSVDFGDGLYDVNCSKQLVMIPPQCQSVSGLIANVGETKRTTTATYLNPNPAPPDMNLQALGTQFVINAGNYHTSVLGTGTSGRIPAGGTKIFYGSATKHNLPGNYDADWSLTWDIHWGHTPGVWGKVIDYVGGEPPVGCSGGPIQIFAAPPTCRVIRWQWEVEPSSTTQANSLIRIEVELTNPNLVPIAVNAAGYTISGIGSGSASNLSSPPGPSASIHNPISSNTTYPSAPEPQYISAGDTVTIVSQKHPYPVPEQYSYNWSGLDVFLGIERWATSGGPNNHPSAYSEPIGPCRETLRLAYLPYIKVYEGDVAVGGRFGTGDGIDACSSGSTIIGTRNDSVAEGRTYGFSKHTGTRSIGASVEYALRAFSSVYGYYSASQRTAGGTPSPHTGLTLANTGTGHGGDYGQPPPTTPPTPPPTDSFANRRCIANYWAVITNQQQTATISGGSLDLADPNHPENSRLYHNGDLSITASGQLEINSAIYVEGDIFINSNIVNNQHNTTPWQQDRRKVGSLYLIAKGNVYINRNVGQIDAIIIAIPPGNNPTNRGIVYTCSQGGTSRTTHLGATNHHRDCSKQLTVNGAVIARNIVLGRTHGSRNLGSAFEHPDGPAVGLPNASNVAEIFYFSPEYYVSLPIASSAESQIGQEEYYRSDSIISLPPLF